MQIKLNHANSYFQKNKLLSSINEICIKNQSEKAQNTWILSQAS